MAGRRLLLFAFGALCSFIFIFTLMPAMKGAKSQQVLGWIGQGGLVLALALLLISRNKRKP